MNCLAELPVEQREAIVLKIWHRLTFEEIGGLLGISPNTGGGPLPLRFAENQTPTGRRRTDAPGRAAERSCL